MRYGGPQTDSSTTVFGRELTANLMFKILPSVNIVNVQMVEQHVPIRQNLHRQKSSVNGSDSTRLNNTLFNSNSHKSTNSSSSLDSEISSVPELKNGIRTKSTEVIQQDEVFTFRSECLLKLTISNQGSQLLCVWVGGGLPGQTQTSQWVAPPAPDSHSVVPGQAAQVSCIIPKMQEDPEQGTSEQDLESAAVQWINSCLSSYWQAAVHQTNYPDKEELQDSNFILTPAFGSQGMIPVKKEQLLRVLEPNLLSLIIKGSIILSVQLSEPFSRGFIDLKTLFPPHGELTGLLEPRLMDESLEEWTIQAPEFEEVPQNRVLESGSSAQTDLPSTPRGPNGELWGIEVEIGEFVNCKFSVQNDSVQDLKDLSISICSERVDEIAETSEVLYRRESGFSDSGLLLIGPVSNIPVTCPANSTFQHK